MPNTMVSLAKQSTLVAQKPEVGVADAPGLIAAAGGHVDHPLLLVLCTKQSSPVSLVGRRWWH